MRFDERYDEFGYEREDADYEEQINEYLTPREVMELLAIGKNTFYKIVNCRTYQRGGSSQQDSKDVLGIQVQFVIAYLIPSFPLRQLRQNSFAQQNAYDFH